VRVVSNFISVILADLAMGRHRHFLPDAGTRRVVDFFLMTLMRHASDDIEIGAADVPFRTMRL
jgi:hypothetical protein